MFTDSSRAGLSAQHLTFSYGGRPVLREVGCQVMPGEMLAIAGPNGSGKTTLLTLLSGARKPDSGTLWLDGRPLTSYKAPERARKIAVVTQFVDPQLHFTVEGVVGMGRTPHTGFLSGLKPHDREAVRDALEITGTYLLADRRFSELSGGEQQRVVLAMALAQETPYLLLDEPTVHLDLHHQTALLDVLTKLRRDRHTAVIAVMHDLNLAALYFDRMTVLDKGVVVNQGPVKEVLTAETAQSVFQTDVHVIQHPTARVPQILLEPES